MDRFCSQERKTVASEVLDLLIPARDLERGGITPGVIIEGKEVAALIVRTAVHVLGHLETVRVDISGRISYRDLAVTTASNILSHIPSDSLHVRGRRSGVVAVDNLISGKESQCVGVVGEDIDGCEDVLEIDAVIGGCWCSTVERIEGCVDIENEVNASICQRRHTHVVVRRIVDRVHTHSVDS